MEKEGKPRFEFVQNDIDAHNEKVRNGTAWEDIRIKKSEYPELSDGHVLNTFRNLRYMLDRLGITVAWNSMKHQREINFPSPTAFPDDEENSALRHVTNLAVLNNMPTSSIDEHLTTLAEKKSYHPIVKCISAKPWDGVPRLDQFIQAVKTTNDIVSYALIRRWMIGAIAAAHSPHGISLQGALVLQGKQNIGKTRWVKSLDPIGCEAVLEGALLDPTCKDSIINLANHWIVELGELDATFKKTDIARLKSYITSAKDKVRFAYAKKITCLPRRTAYVATVNEQEFLVDVTGNRRWWTIEVEAFDFKHGLDMQQVWAEVYHLFKGGEQYWPTEDETEVITVANVEHEKLDPYEEKVLDLYDWTAELAHEMTSSQVLNAIGVPNPSIPEAMRMAGILYKLTKLKPKRRTHGRFYKLPRLRIR